IEVATKGLAKVHAELESLRKTLGKATGGGELDKQTNRTRIFANVANTAFTGLQAGLKKANEMAKAFGDTLTQVGNTAKVAFLGGGGGGGGGGGFAQIIAGLQRLLAVVQDVFQRVFAVVSGVMERLAPVFQRMFDAIVPLVTGIFDRLMPLFEALMPIVEMVI